MNASKPDKLVLASGNPGKLAELKSLLEPLGIDVVPQSAFGVPDAVEDGDSFAANSLIKARHAATLVGLPAVADDSGLVVEALNGRPGIFSARFAGPDSSDADNVAKLLEEMRGVRDRRAAFHCVATFVDDPASEPLVAEGTWSGTLLDAPRGRGGFGYDPVFLDPDSGRASAELEPSEKNARSHRGKALRALVAALEARYG